MTRITLDQMEFHAFHGCLPHEKLLGNTFIVTLSMNLDTSRAAVTDNLDDTLNYQLVYNVVKDEMAIPSQLLEHLIQRIADRLINEFPVIEHLHIALSKRNPPLGGKVANVIIETELSQTAKL